MLNTSISESATVAHGATGRIANALSVDVEDYFQVSAFANFISRDDWSQHKSRVSANTYRLLEIFDEFQVKGTFFTLGWVAERTPELIREIANAGHELASHGYDHTLVTKLDEASFRADVTRTKAVLEDIGGVAVDGYRAPTFSIDASTPWAFSILKDVGHKYSSSTYPVKHDLYGNIGAPRFAFRDTATGLLEIPISTIELLGRNIPCGGGGYFRLYPYLFTRWCFRHINGRESAPGVFYTHPWEFDPEQPKFENLSAKARFRHYVNLDRTAQRLRKLLRDFHWGRVDEVFAHEIVPE